MKLFFRFIFIGLIPIIVFSQQKEAYTIQFANIQVSKVLSSLEKTYHVKFSYQDDLIKDKKITLIKKTRTLEEVLAEISTLINIQFQRLNNRYFFLKKTSSITNEQHLNEVVIQGYLTKGISKNKNTSFQIKPKKLEILPGLTEADVLESIQQLPGVVSPNETATGLIVRGGTSDQNRLIWDGINIYHNGHLFGMISAFNPNIIENVTFHNKGTNPRFGERISSVIDIETSKKVSKKVNVEFGLNGINADAYIEAPIIKDKLSLQFSYRRSYEGLFESSTFKKLELKVFQNTNIDESSNSEESFYFKDYNLKLNFAPNSNNNFFVSILHIDNDLDHVFSDIATNSSYQNILDIENDGYSLNWEKKWNEKVTHQVQVYLSKYRLNYNFITKQNFQQTSDYDKRNTIFDSGLSSELKIKTNKKSELLIGYQYTLKDVSYEFKETADLTFILDRDKTKINTHSFYTNYLYRNSKLFDIEGGVRLNYYKELNAFRVEPRIVINKNLFSNFKLQITGEIKNQIISQIDETVLSDLSLENKLWRLANGETFPIIKSNQISAGLLYSKNGWSIDFDHYYKNINGITALSLGFLNATDNKFHIGKQKIIGTDFYLKKDFKTIKMWLSYSLIDVKSKFENLNNDTYFTSSTEIKHAISASLSYKIKQFQIALGWKWQTGKPYTKAVVNTVDNSLFFEGINTERLPNYHRLDFSSTYEFKISKNNKTKAKVGISIRNIYNRNNYLSREYIGNNGINDPVKIIDKYSIGITPNFLFRVYW